MKIEMTITEASEILMDLGQLGDVGEATVTLIRALTIVKGEAPPRVWNRFRTRPHEGCLGQCEAAQLPTSQTR
jgi:hypothetical protein